MEGNQLERALADVAVSHRRFHGSCRQCMLDYTFMLARLYPRLVDFGESWSWLQLGLPSVDSLELRPLPVITP